MHVADKKYIYAPRMVAWINGLLYQADATKLHCCVAAAVLGMNVQILMTHFELKFGGTKPTEPYSWLLTGSTHWHDLRVLCWYMYQCRKRGISMSQLLEEGAEHGFSPDHVAQADTRSQRNLGPQVELLDRRELRSSITPSTKRASKHRTFFTTLPPLVASA